MNFESIKPRLHQFEPVFLSVRESEILRVLEKSARVVCNVVPNGAVDEEQIIKQVDSFLSKAWDSDRQPPVWLSIHLFHEALVLDGICRALVTLAEFLGPTKTKIIIHLAQPSADWSAIQALAKSLRETFDRSREIAGIELIAPFGEFHSAEMEALFNVGVRVRFAAGWTKGCPPDQFSPVNAGVLRSFSELGFRTPIEWYVHTGNMQAFEEQIPQLLIDNYASGFSLPLVSQNPYYQFGSGFPELPDAVDYCQLLARSYKQYPYYDDVFSPLTDLSLLVKEGGWHSKMNISTGINFILDAEGRVGLYRQSPALAKTWTNVSEVATTSLDILRNRFLEFTGNVWQWEKVPYCHECGWRYICGGLDASALPDKDMDTMCGHRKLFLEHFALLRAPDYVIGQ
jgi:hypothetical protein